MSLSLKEQLLKAGLVTQQQVEKAEQQQRQHQHQKHKHHPKAQQLAREQDERRAALAREQAAKAARDQELNRQRQEKAARKAMHAEIRRLVEQHRLPRIEDSEAFFNFVHGKKIHRMAVDDERRNKLLSGEVKIVRYAPGYAVVTPDIAARIAERDPAMVVDLNEPSTNAAPAEDDPYKDFVVPDDLMW
jgi:uncharacterized protein